MAAGAIFDLAKQAYTRAGNQPTDQSPGQMDALVAIILAVAAAEAVINEITELSGLMSKPLFDKEPNEVGDLSSLLSDLEDAHAPLTTKYMFARWVLTGRPYDKAAQPYQDFALLVELRNCLIHFRPLDQTEFSPTEGITIKPPKIFDKLRSKKILGRYPYNYNAVWFLRLGTKAAARFACNAAAAMVNDLLTSIPPGNLRDAAEGYRSAFTVL